MSVSQNQSVEVGKRSNKNETKPLRHKSSKDGLLSTFKPNKKDEFDSVYGAVLYVYNWFAMSFS